MKGILKNEMRTGNVMRTLLKFLTGKKTASNSPAAFAMSTLLIAATYRKACKYNIKIILKYIFIKLINN